MRIEANYATYDMELIYGDLETQVDRHEEITKFDEGVGKSSCDPGFLCWNMRIEANNTSYDIGLKNQDFETQVERHEEISKFEEGLDKSALVN